MLQRWIFTGIIVIGLLGCGPVYTLKDVYIPPTDPAARACALSCTETNTQCDNNCRTEYQHCSRQAELDALNTLPTAMHIYRAELSAYRAARSIHKHDKMEYHEQKTHLQQRLKKNRSLCQKHDEQACNNITFLRDSLTDLQHSYFRNYGPLYIAPLRPIKPTLAAEAAYLRNNRCSKGCSCKKHFSICYQNCGGRIDTRRYCVSGCK